MYVSSDQGYFLKRKKKLQNYKAQKGKLRRSKKRKIICAHTRTTTKMGPAKLQIRVSWTESQQKSGFP